MSQTLDDCKGRADEILNNAAAFNSRLLSRIQEFSNSPDNLAGNDTLVDDVFEELNEEDNAEQDIEEQIRQQKTTVETIDEQLLSKSIEDYVSLLEDMSYKDTAEATMKLLMENGLSEYQKAVPRECPLCLDDDTIVEEDGKYKVWPAKHLPDHMRTKIHFKSSALMRKLSFSSALVFSF